MRQTKHMKKGMQILMGNGFRSREEGTRHLQVCEPHLQSEGGAQREREGGRKGAGFSALAQPC